MKKNIIKMAASALTAITLLSSGGCALVQFEDPAELKKSQEELPVVDAAESLNMAALLDKERLSMSETLTDANGAEIAVYQADFPYFDDGGVSPAIVNINAYYTDEFVQIKDDKEMFFQIVSEKPSSTVRTSIFTYELLEAPEGYVSVLRTFEGVDSLGSQQKNHYCEVFSAATGWKLRFADIFGEDQSKAITVLREEIEQWCFDNDYSANWLYNAEDALLTDNFCFDGQTAYVGLSSYISPGGETLVEISFEELAQYLK